MKLNIREATQSDFKQLLDLNNEWFDEGISPGTLKESEYSFRKEFKNSTFFIAEVNSEIIGFLKCRVKIAKEDSKIHHISEGEKYVDLDSVFIKKNFRNKGIGTKLLKYCIANVRRVGYKKVIASADSKNLQKLVKFYERQGFKTLFTRMLLEFK
ncbi:Mycothiol acetyltransferase [Candidatus Tiddalikarchaeum anstoanum]|nr:Mycothiol acetyltransferase [Candidatus Tiddalikarchaeum anstoanum]